jgi:hypothetical protein
MRIAVAGHPLCGKSTYAATLGLPHHNTDSLLESDLNWGQISEAVSHWFDNPGPWVISGVVVPRALRKWRHLKGRNSVPPLDYFVFITRPSLDDLSSAQRSMARGIDAVVDGLRPWLYKIMVEPERLMNHFQRPPSGFFELHRCWRCDDGAKLCAQHGYWRCEFPHARND